jgi:hypothetical protein
MTTYYVVKKLNDWAEKANPSSEVMSYASSQLQEKYKDVAGIDVNDLQRRDEERKSKKTMIVAGGQEVNVFRNGKGEYDEEATANHYLDKYRIESGNESKNRQIAVKTADENTKEWQKEVKVARDNYEKQVSETVKVATKQAIFEAKKARETAGDIDQSGRASVMSPQEEHELGQIIESQIRNAMQFAEPPRPISSLSPNSSIRSDIESIYMALRENPNNANARTQLSNLLKIHNLKI